MREVNGDGPIPARLMIVGEAPGAEEEIKGIPFCGVSGIELNRMLGEAKITRSECFVTNVCRVRPPNNDISFFIPKAKKDVTSRHVRIRDRFVTSEIAQGCDRLLSEIDLVRPNLIIALGNIPLWALTGKWGILKWRGSMLHSDLRTVKVIPTIHPAAVLRQWDLRAATVNDLRRAGRYRNGEPYPEPKRNFIIRPDFERAKGVLELLFVNAGAFHTPANPMRLSFDLETRYGHIACAGISWTLEDAICIPLMCVERWEGYWSVDQETFLINLLRQLLTHPNVSVVGQNILYDCQYTYRHWHFVPNVGQDCMIAQHSLFSDLPKSLAYQASMYCEYYVYWKDEGKNWDPGMGEESLWHYNCLDCVYTDEVGRVESEIVPKMGLSEVYDFQQSLLWPILQTMLRGVRINLDRRSELYKEVTDEIKRRTVFIQSLLGHPLNPSSPKQMQALFYQDLKLPVQVTRAAKGIPSRPTLNDEALQKISKIEPLVKPLINAISDIRTLGIFQDMLSADLDTDSRMRCAYNIGGSASGKSAPKTYRLSSSENAFGSGLNLQTIPSEKSKSLGKAASRGSIAGFGDAYQYPNLRTMFVPDLGYTFFDGDLDRADLQVVARESEDQLLKEALATGADIHLLNAFSLEGKDPPPIEELVETHPRYLDHRGPKKHLREFAKVFCHGSNYGGKARTMAAHTGRTIHETERAQKIWFGAHPGILKWHRRIEDQVRLRRFVENRFGYRWYIFDRLDSILPEAIAWIPQSTVSVVINKIWMNLYENLRDVQVLMQVHDSLVGQYPTSLQGIMPILIESFAQIIVPYDDPLTIPFTVKTSEVSWGDCE